MAKLIYITNVSLDGYIEDEQGSFAFTEPTDEAFALITEIIRPVSTWLYGRRLYETMAVWETDASLAEASPARAEFARLWQRGDKVVYSTSLHAPCTQRTRIERSLDVDAARAIKAAAEGVLAVGGAAIAAQFFAAGLVDECQLFVGPALLGAGKPGLPSKVRLDLELLDERRFDNGAVYLRYAVKQ